MSAYIVERAALVQNIRALRARAGQATVWAVIKGDGYGIGAVPLAKILREEGISHFCVTELREAALLRENGFDADEILMLRATCDEAELSALAELGVILTVGSVRSAQMLAQIAQRRGAPLRIHLKVDTGMGRYGFRTDELAEMRAIYADKNLMPCGIYTHFNCAYADEALTRREYAAFQATVQALRESGCRTGMVHCCNSPAFLRFPEMHCDAVRLGSAILGRVGVKNDLRPVGYCLSHVDELHFLPKGSTTGYSAVWRAKRDTVAAIVPIGYYHGLRLGMKPDLNRRRDALRALFGDLRAFFRGNASFVQIGGRNCRVIGVVGMLHCAVDVTGMKVKVGDEVRIALNPLHRKGIPVEYR